MKYISSTITELQHFRVIESNFLGVKKIINSKKKELLYTYCTYKCGWQCKTVEPVAC